MPADAHVLIADDHVLFLQGLRFALVDALGKVRVSEASTLDQVLDILGRNPDVTLASLDLRMPGMRGGDGLRQIRRLHPALPLAVLSGVEDRRTILTALECGASGFIPKSLPAAAIVSAMRDIMAGRVFVPPSITAIDQPDDDFEADAASLPIDPARPFDPANLTPRQQEVLNLLLIGRSTKEIAREMDIAEGTVKIYVAAIFRALGVRNRVEAVTRATALGFGPNRPG